MHLVWWQYNWDIEEIFWSFLSLGFQSISQLSTRDKKVCQLFLLKWRSVLQQQHRNCISESSERCKVKRPWVYFEGYNENLTFSYSFLPVLWLLFTTKERKRTRESPCQCEMDDSNFRIYWDESLRSVRSDVFYSVFILNACRFKVMSLPGTVWHGKYSDPTLRSSIPAAMTEFSER